jgi:hypothetical protein
VIRLSNADTRRLVKDLDHAQAMLREYAADQSYRADAHRIMRDRIMAEYHRQQAETAGELADAITETGGRLLALVESAEAIA